MKHVLETREVLGLVDPAEGGGEVCVSADATYDDKAGRVVVQLDCYLRTTDLRVPEKRLTAEWLPKSETVTESVESGEAVAMARDIFHRWVRKVRELAPSLHNARC